MYPLRVMEVITHGTKSIYLQHVMGPVYFSHVCGHNQHIVQRDQHIDQLGQHIIQIGQRMYTDNKSVSTIIISAQYWSTRSLHRSTQLTIRLPQQPTIVITRLLHHQFILCFYLVMSRLSLYNYNHIKTYVISPA